MKEEGEMIWEDMSYNQLEIYTSFQNKLETEPEEIEEEDVFNEFDQTNSFIFNRYERIL